MAKSQKGTMIEERFTKDWPIKTLLDTLRKIRDYLHIRIEWMEWLAEEQTGLVVWKLYQNAR